ncbi:MAG: hypothetical protein ABFD83_00395 [Armatimonadota bacterium]
MNAQTLDWLLGEDNPGVRVRTLIGLCGLPNDDSQVITARSLVTRTLDVASDLSWIENDSVKIVQNVVALAESGLTRNDVFIDPLMSRWLDGGFDANCFDYLIMRLFLMLGYGDDDRIKSRLAQMAESQLPDGGWICLHRLNKMKRVPKSCIKANMHALLLLAEMKQRGVAFAGTDELIQYFLRRRLFYRMDSPTRLVIEHSPGLRMIDAFFPLEGMRVGLPMLLYALSVLGAGRAPELQEAWNMLEAKRDEMGRVKHEGNVITSSLPKERVGRPGKWVTLYACLAQKALNLEGSHAQMV